MNTSLKMAPLFIATILSAKAFASPVGGSSEHSHGVASKPAPHCSETVRKHKSGPQAKQEAEFEEISVPCHNHMEHVWIGGEGSGQASPSTLSERKSKI